jgi:transcriptional regulator with XRE-family HTH domain
MVERIRQLLQDKQLTPTQFADAIGIARPIISHILSGRNKPSLEVVQRILAAFADLSMPWLLNGTEPMWVTAAPVAAAPVPTTTSRAANAPDESPAVAPVTTAEGARTAKSRHAPVEGHTDGPTGRTNQPKLPLSAAPLPMPRRFQATATGQNKPATVEATPEEAQRNTGAIAAPGLAEVAQQLAAPSALPPQPAPAQSSEVPAPAATSDAAAAFLLQPGKAIRRIVIFYQDGSFADYQPE